jgi:hypothetical protein
MRRAMQLLAGKKGIVYPPLVISTIGAALPHAQPSFASESKLAQSIYYLVVGASASSWIIPLLRDARHRNAMTAS